MDNELVQIWIQVQAHLERSVPPDTYGRWLASLRPVTLEAGVLLVAAPNSRAKWTADRFGRVLQCCGAAVLGPETRVDVVPEDRAQPPPTDPPTLNLNPKYTFEQFVIGCPNRFAHAAALAVAELPGHAYNPLFVYGPPGVGKTHLLQAIGNYVCAHDPQLTVRYATAESFTADFVRAVQSGGVERFKARYRGADVLLLDDVQFLQRKVRTEEEFFHTFNELYEGGRQLVLSCDRLPSDMAALERRLLERFQSGLVVDIRPPDLATRLTFLRKRAQVDGVPVDEAEALETLARDRPGTIRTLEGAFIKVVAAQSLADSHMTVDIVRDTLNGPGGEPAPSPPSIERVQAAVCEAFGISREALVSPSRAASLVWPRHLAIYLSRELTSATLPAIGEEFGGRSHNTVLHACRQAGRRIGQDVSALALAGDLRARLTTAGADRHD